MDHERVFGGSEEVFARKHGETVILARDLRETYRLQYLGRALPRGANTGPFFRVRHFRVARNPGAFDHM